MSVCREIPYVGKLTAHFWPFSFSPKPVSVARGNHGRFARLQRRDVEISVSSCYIIDCHHFIGSSSQRTSDRDGRPSLCATDSVDVILTSEKDRLL